MKRLLLFLLMAVSAFGGTRYITNPATPSIAAVLLSDGSVVMIDGYTPTTTNAIATYNFVTNWVATHAGVADISQWSTNPAVSTIEAANFNLNAVHNIYCNNFLDVNGTSYETDFINSSSGDSYIDLQHFGNFGIYNGETLGPNVNIGSANGRVVLSGSSVDVTGGPLNFGGNKGTNAADPTSAQDVATKAYVDAHAGGGSSANWSTNPAVSDVDMFSHSVVNAGGYSVAGTINGTLFGPDIIESDSGNSHFWLTPDANFGINNGELPGVGSDINLVSANGGVVVNAANGLEFTAGASITATSMGAVTLQFANADNIDFGGGVIVNAGGITATALTATGDITSSGGNLNITVGNIYASSSDDGTGSRIQSAGDTSTAGFYWANGVQGQTEDHTVVVGDVLHFVGGIYVGTY